MNRKITCIGVLAVFMLVTISFASAVETNQTNIDKKESPLYGIRTRRAISEKIVNIIENIKTKFFGERLFYPVFKGLIFDPENERIVTFSPVPCTILFTYCNPFCKIFL
jgi:hypothetical protein